LHPNTNTRKNYTRAIDTGGNLQHKGVKRRKNTSVNP
jgi:hypothetical protein